MKIQIVRLGADQIIPEKQREERKRGAEGYLNKFLVFGKDDAIEGEPDTILVIGPFLEQWDYQHADLFESLRLPGYRVRGGGTLVERLGKFYGKNQAFGRYPAEQLCRYAEEIGAFLGGRQVTFE